MDYQPNQPNITPPPVVTPPPAAPVNIQQSGFTQEEIKPFTWRAVVKLAYIILFIFGSTAGAYFLSRKVWGQQAGQPDSSVLLSTRYQPVLWKDFGEVFEPMIKIPLYYPSGGWQEKEFLLDSGALVSSLPRDEAPKMGLSLAKLPRCTFGGFGGTTSFAYKGEAKMKLGEQEVSFPLVFTEAAGTKPILGRSGFFERYNIYFNSSNERIEIRK